MTNLLEIEFVYEEISEKDKINSKESVITSDRLSKLPKSWITKLNESSVSGDFSEAEAVVDKIREHDGELADALIELVNEFRFDILQEILENV